MPSPGRYRGTRTRVSILAALTRAAFVFQNPRRALLAAVEAGTEPDTALLGLNHVGVFGVDGRLHDAWLTRRDWPRLLHRLAWSGRELPLPFEVGGTDVVFTPLANLFPLTARLRRLPVVVVNYGLNLILRRSSGARRRLLSASLRSAAAVVCLGKAQREDAIEIAGLDPDRVHVVLLGADVDWLRPLPPPEAADPYVLTVGRDLARDLATFSDAVARLGVRAEIVGHPRTLEGVRLPANVRVRSGISATELRDAYAGAACVVVPQRRDEYPYGSESGGLTAVCEALAMGRPIVASDRGVLRDYLDPDELVPAGDPAALAAAIEAALGDGARGARSRRRAEERHSTRRFAQGIAPILRNSAQR
jgi:glycosyltransferase involved in cell wall biosynthesis